jgi:hypothetical protein
VRHGRNPSSSLLLTLRRCRRCRIGRTGWPRSSRWHAQPVRNCRRNRGNSRTGIRHRVPTSRVSWSLRGRRIPIRLRLVVDIAARSPASRPDSATRKGRGRGGGPRARRERRGQHRAAAPAHGRAGLHHIAGEPAGRLDDDGADAVGIDAFQRDCEAGRLSIGSTLLTAAS